MDYSLENHQSYLNEPVSQLPTPSLIVSLPTLKRNVDRLQRDVEELGIGFRPHVKTMKTIEVTRLMLANGKYRSIVASTLAEIRGALPLVKEGLLDECLYGLPVYPGCLPGLLELRKLIRITLMIDNEQHIELLENQCQAHPWDVFVKIDVGSHRAGVSVASPSLRKLVNRIEASKHVNLIGFYCHAGHSYAGRSPEEAEATLHAEISGVLDAASLLPTTRELTVSIGATPTAHVIKRLKATIPSNIRLELHAGNFPTNDLQQLSTNVISENDQAIRVATEVCSVYPERNEALVNAGVIALSRETSGFPGFGRVVDQPDWAVVRLSQEHGILGTENSSHNAADIFRVGQRVYLYCNHTCITAAAFHVFYVVDENDVVVDTWLPWKGW
ncbi:hypothetical protein Trisim1_006154 [Trichoderma cf. simile WF8]